MMPSVRIGCLALAPSLCGELAIGPNSVVVTNDGSNDVFVGLMWDQGLWRYVEP